MGQMLFDQYSLLHFATGIVAYFIEIKMINWIILHTIFEIIENTNYGIYIIQTYLYWFWPGGKDKADMPINSVGDTISAILGWYAAYILSKIGKKRQWIIE
jgi:hypothetical protein